MIKYKVDLLIILFLFSTIILIGACATPTTKEQDNVVGIQDKVSDERFSEFILGVGDTIDITVYRKKTSEFILGVGDTIDITVYRKETSEFILGVGDTIDIVVYRHGDLNRSIKLDTSGKIMFPLIGEVQAAGKRVFALRDEIQQRLSKYLVNPQVSINISSRQSLKVDELSTSFTISAQEYGKIMFPLIGEVQAAGKHVIELRDEIQQRLSKYLFDPQVNIKVSPIQSLKMDDLSLSTKIGSNGKLTFPLIGDVQVAGRGVFALRDEIQQRLSKYLVNPQVRIDVSAVVSHKVHVLGEVKSPGTFILDHKILAFEAISRAGGFTTDANEKNVLLVRSEKGIAKVTALSLDIREIVKDGKLAQNIYLKNGDIIYVPPSLIANIERFMVRFHNIINPFVTIERGIILAPEAVDVLRGEERRREVIVAP